MWISIILLETDSSHTAQPIDLKTLLLQAEMANAIRFNIPSEAVTAYN